MPSRDARSSRAALTRPSECPWYRHSQESAAKSRSNSASRSRCGFLDAFAVLQDDRGDESIALAVAVALSLVLIFIIIEIKVLHTVALIHHAEPRVLVVRI